MKKIILSLIFIYQKLFSPDHSFWAQWRGWYCKYYPSCSEYGKLCFETM